MMFNNANLPRVFQANIYRFFKRVVLPSLEQLPQRNDEVVGKTQSLDQLLEKCAKEIDDHTANEARRAFAFILSAIFERQLRMWCRVEFHDNNNNSCFDTLPFDKLVDSAVYFGKINFVTSDKPVDDIKELHLLANVIRHGEGASCRKLHDRAPHFWSYSANGDTRQANEQHHLSETIKIKNEHLHWYVRALLRFWGFADREPLAVIDSPPWPCVLWSDWRLPST